MPARRQPSKSDSDIRTCRVCGAQTVRPFGPHCGLCGTPWPPEARWRAYHFLRADMTAAAGNEPPWTVGETRTIEGDIAIGKRGYHSSPSWLGALTYAQGSVACMVDVSEPEDIFFTALQVSHTKTLLAAQDVSRELLLFACDCAERAAGREPLVAAAWVAARDAAQVAAEKAAIAASQDTRWKAWDAERAWQRQRLAELLDPLFEEEDA